MTRNAFAVYKFALVIDISLYCNLLYFLFKQTSCKIFSCKNLFPKLTALLKYLDLL